jgi:hypothetical protein
MRRARLCRTDGLDKVKAPYSNWAEFTVEIKELPDQGDTSSYGHRDPYEVPRLKVFGPVGGLTQSGTQGSGESGNMGAMKAFP